MKNKLFFIFGCIIENKLKNYLLIFNFLKILSNMYRILNVAINLIYYKKKIRFKKCIGEFFYYIVFLYIVYFRKYNYIYII
jgi:hypothetical protein